MLLFHDSRMGYHHAPPYSVSCGSVPWPPLQPAWFAPLYSMTEMIEDVHRPSSISSQSDDSSRSSLSPIYLPPNFYGDASWSQSADSEEYNATKWRCREKNKEVFECKWFDCHSMFTTLNSLSNHVATNHADAEEGLFYCKWKGCMRGHKGFNARYKMLVHVRTHTNEKPHKCNQCDKSFSRTENLKIHIRSHSGEKPYICPVEGCNKAYSNSSDRFKHTRTHSVNKPYCCKVPGCNKRYTDPSSLRKHVKTYKHQEMISNEDTTDEVGSRSRNNSETLMDVCSVEQIPHSPSRSETANEEHECNAIEIQRDADECMKTENSVVLLSPKKESSDSVTNMSFDEPLNLKNNLDLRIYNEMIDAPKFKTEIINSYSDVPLDLRVRK